MMISEKTQLLVNHTTEYELLGKLKRNILYGIEIIGFNLDANTKILCCSPDYSASHCQYLSHALTPTGVPLEVINVEMPYPKEYFDIECPVQLKTSYSPYGNKIPSAVKNIIIYDSAIIRGINFKELRDVLESEWANYGVRNVVWASMFLHSKSSFKPLVTVRTYDQDDLQFWWENDKNPYWD